MAREHAVRWGWLRGMYLYTAVGAGAAGIGFVAAPEVTRALLGLPPQDPLVSFGMVGSVFLAFAVVSVLGLKDPLRYAPILLLQLVYKVVWVVAVVLPRVLAGTFPRHAALFLAVYATFIAGDLVALPYAWLRPGGAREPSGGVA